MKHGRFWLEVTGEDQVWIGASRGVRPLLLQLFLFTLSSFLLSLLLGHWFLLSGPHTQFNRHIELVGMDNKYIKR